MILRTGFEETNQPTGEDCLHCLPFTSSLDHLSSLSPLHDMSSPRWRRALVSCLPWLLPVWLAGCIAIACMVPGEGPGAHAPSRASLHSPPSLPSPPSHSCPAQDTHEAVTSAVADMKVHESSLNSPRQNPRHPLPALTPAPVPPPNSPQPLLPRRTLPPPLPRRIPLHQRAAGGVELSPEPAAPPDANRLGSGQGLRPAPERAEEAEAALAHATNDSPGNRHAHSNQTGDGKHTDSSSSRADADKGKGTEASQHTHGKQTEDIHSKGVESEDTELLSAGLAIDRRVHEAASPGRMAQCERLALDTHTLKATHASGVSGGPLDIVISWINYTSGFAEDGPPLPRAYAGVGRDRDPFSEIMFTLRSLAVHGLYQRAGKVYILYNQNKHAPPVFLKENHPKVRAVPQSEVLEYSGLSGEERENPKLHVTLAHMHRIHDLSEWFLYLQDDMMLTQDFDVSHLYDNATNRMRFHLNLRASLHPHASARAGDLSAHFLRSKLGYDAKLQDGLHCPVLVKRCLMEEIESRLAADLFKCRTRDMRGTTTPCDFASYQFHTFYQNYAIGRGLAVNVPRDKGFAAEIHTRAADAAARARSVRERLRELGDGAVQWLNVQGPGVSDEYERSEEIREAVDEWYGERFPEKGEWEV